MKEVAFSTKYRIGDTVMIRSEPGRTGTVLMIWPGEENAYALDVHPGAVGHYVYAWMTFPDGTMRLAAYNRFVESDLSEKQP